MACCLTAPSLYLTNIDFSSARFCRINLRAISQLLPMLLFCLMSLNIKLLKPMLCLQGINELIYLQAQCLLYSHKFLWLVFLQVTVVEHRPSLSSQKGSSCVSLIAELWGVYRECFREYWPCYNGAALYLNRYMISWWNQTLFVLKRHL